MGLFGKLIGATNSNEVREGYHEFTDSIMNNHLPTSEKSYIEFKKEYVYGKLTPEQERLCFADYLAYIRRVDDIQHHSPPGPHYDSQTRDMNLGLSPSEWNELGLGNLTVADIYAADAEDQPDLCSDYYMQNVLYPKYKPIGHTSGGWVPSGCDPNIYAKTREEKAQLKLQNTKKKEKPTWFDKFKNNNPEKGFPVKHDGLPDFYWDEN